MHTEFADFAQEMSRVQGAVVVTRPDLVQNSDALTPANHLDFVKTLQSYFAIFKESLLSRYSSSIGNFVTRHPSVLVRSARL